MAKAFKISGKGLNSVWLTGSELLDIADDIMSHYIRDYEAWNVMETVGDLEDKGYTIEIKSISDASLERKHAEQISRHIKFSH